MRYILAFLLTISLLLSLTACGKPAPTTPGGQADTPTQAPTVAPTTQPSPVTVDLVLSYENEEGTLLGNHVGAWRMDFTYEADHRSGTVVLTMPDETANGSFTCDENYNINAITFLEEEATVSFVMTFDDAHRLTSATSSVTEAGQTQLRYGAKYMYDDAGRTLYQEQHYVGQMLQITATEYRPDGKVLRQTMIVQPEMEGASPTTMVTAYRYDSADHLQAIEYCDAEGNVIQNLAFTHSMEGENDCYTTTMGSESLVMVFDPQGKLIRQDSYSGEELINRNEMEYDAKGNVLRQTSWVSYSDATVVKVYTYTDSGRLASYSQILDGETYLQQRTTFETMEIPQ